MVQINFCPSCGCELSQGSFICPSCELDIEELFAKEYLLASNRRENSIELYECEIGEVVIEDDLAGEEIVIVVSESSDGNEVVVDLDELGIDVENLDGDVNIIVQVEGAEDMDIKQANEWFFDDDPYGIVYYEFPKE